MEKKTKDNDDWAYLGMGALNTLILACWFGMTWGLSTLLFNLYSEPYRAPIFLFVFCILMGYYFCYMKKELKSESKTKADMETVKVLMDGWLSPKPLKRSVKK